MKRVLPLVTSLFVVGVSAGGCGKSAHQPADVKEAWNSINAPLRFNSNYTVNFDSLPKSASLSVIPWTDSYWPSNQGGIAARWNSSHRTGFGYNPPSVESIRRMSIDDLAKLSPAEKYDIYVGSYDFPTVRRERNRTRPGMADWEGICHGWAPAAINYSEPRPVVLRGAGGINVPFGSSDIKGLLSYYQGEITGAAVRSLGARCNTTGGRERPECRDINAGAFHVVLTNQIGLLKKSFVADVTRDLQVWNQPVHGFSTRVLGDHGPSLGAAPGTVKEIRVETSMTYSQEVQPQWGPLVGTAGHSDTTKVYRYRVELNSRNEIIGGEWEQDDRPDFLWNQETPRFSGYFAKLEEIYKASVSGAPQPPPQPNDPPVVIPPPLPANPPPVVVRPNRIGRIECPQGAFARPIGNEGGLFCIDGARVRGPFPAAMVDKCTFTYHRADCNAGTWPIDIFVAVRGDALCPHGTFYDPVSTYCSEGDNVFGPFPQEMVDRCAAMGGGSACTLPRWSRNFIISLLR